MSSNFAEVQGSEAPRAAVVLGAGVAGLAAAWRLAALGCGPVMVLEREQEVGGLARTVAFDGARLDVGSHRIHPDYFPEALALLRELLGDDLLRVPRRGRLRLNGSYIEYPPRLSDFLAVLGPREIARCAVGLVGARLRGRRPTRATAGSYEGYLLPLVGRRAYDLFYAPYARKVFGIEPEAVSVVAAKTRLSTERPWTVLARMIARKSAGRDDDRIFYYPADGFGSIGDALLGAARQRGVDVRMGVSVTGMQGQDGRIDSLTFTGAEGRTEQVRVSTVVSTIPLGVLVRLVAPPAPSAVHEALSGLRWRGIRILQVVLDRERCLEGETYYFPEERYCFGRVSEPPLFSARLRPGAERTALNIEVICTPGDALWSLAEPEFFSRVLRDVEAAALFRRDEVRTYRSVKVPAVYPVYDVGYEARLLQVLDWVEGHENLYSIGRGGLFLHGNTDHSIALGLRVAEHLAQPGARAAGWRRDLRIGEFRVRD